MGNIDPPLQTALLLWRHEMATRDEAGATPAAGDPLPTRSIRVLVKTGLSEPELTGLGLRTATRVSPTIVMGEVALADVEGLAAAAGIEAVSRERSMRLDLDTSVPHTRAPQVWNGSPSFRGSRVIIGILDSGIDIFHESFRLPDRTKTRILRLWDMNGTANNGPGSRGTVFTDNDIERAIAGSAPAPPRDGHGGHGTHVASIAAGDGSPEDRCNDPFTFVGVAPAADLIVVAGGSREGNVIAALNFVFDEAAAISGTNPLGRRAVVVNMSFGYSLGPHDGTDLISQEINRLLHEANGVTPRVGRAVVKSAGNEGNKKRHARQPIAANGTATFAFEIPASESGSGDIDTDQMEAWFDGGATLALTVQGPPGAGTNSHAFAAPGEASVISGTRVTVAYGGVEANGQKRISIEIDASAATPAQPGPWQLTFTETAGAAATIDVWVEREDSDVHPEFANPERKNTISIPGNCQSVITVGSYDSHPATGDFELAGSSSWGLEIAEMPAQRRLRPDISAPGVNIVAANSGETPTGSSCSACCDVLHVAKSGTSMATPHVTGAVALMLQKNRDLTYVQVRRLLQLAANRARIPAGQAPPVLPGANGGSSMGTAGQPDFLEIHQNHKWGAGRLDVEKAMSITPAAAPPPPPPPPPAGGGGGGGGGGGRNLAAFPVPGDAGFAPRVGQWLARQGLADRPAVQLIAALVSTHVDEVRRLIDTNKRVAVVWRRGGGPAILRHRIQQPLDTSPILPEAVGGFSCAALIDRLMRLFARFGSSPLRADVARWRDFVLAAPGSDIDALEARIEQLQR